MRTKTETLVHTTSGVKPNGRVRTKTETLVQAVSNLINGRVRAKTETSVHTEHKRGKSMLLLSSERPKYTLTIVAVVCVHMCMYVSVYEFCVRVRAVVCVHMCMYVSVYGF